MSLLLFDHLWQSTAVLVVIGILTMFFRNNGADVRHALWTAASIKFLLPFAVLSELGLHLLTLWWSPVTEPPMVQAFYGVAKPFSGGPIFVALPAPSSPVWLPLLPIWGAGFFLVVAIWLFRWLKLHAVLRQAREADIAAPMQVKFSPMQLGPGLIGVLHPVLLLPEGITQRLSPEEMDAILAHEICHLRRRDNLLAAIHMLVEAMFWFYPPVWWIGTRLLEERERACDESVLAQGKSPRIYAESILKVCQFYLNSPLECAAGISGAGLKQRLEEIMENKLVHRLKNTKKALLAVTALLAVAAPFTLGLFHAPSAQAQTAAAGGTSPAMEQINIRASLMDNSNAGASNSAGGGSIVTPINLEPIQSTHTPPPYPATSQRLSNQGTVELMVTIGTDGNATDAIVNKSSGYGELDAAAIAWVKSHWRWQPPTHNGKPVMSKSFVAANFGLVRTSP